MSEKSLRSKIIRLAHQKPELREHLLPLVTDKVSAKKVREGGKVGFLSGNKRKPGRYDYATVEKIEGDKVCLARFDRGRYGGWHRFEMSLRQIIAFSKEESVDMPGKMLVKIM